ncbi:MAG: nitrilase-related carbon-nitrogen hydrolase [Planifilum sp.]|jgi:predicted amidohydrolase
MRRGISPFYAASVQFNPRLNRRDENIEALYEVVRQAAEGGAKLIVTPEMATTGYQYEDRQAISPFVDTIPGIATRRLGEIAERYGAYIVLGMAEVEQETGLFYNSAALIGPEGVLGKYRKLHLWATEEPWACPGDLGVPVFSTAIGNIALIICMDAVYFETARLAALQGADILAFPTNSSGQTVTLLQGRARSNGLYIVSANRSNTEKEYHMVGGSALWSPRGELLDATPYRAEPAQGMDDPSWVMARIDPALYENPAKQRLQERRPALYTDLMLHRGSWGFPPSPSRSIAAAALQYTPCIGDKGANLAKIEGLLEETAFPETGERLIVLPELSLTGPVSHLPKEQIRRWAETEAGSTLREMGRLARRYRASVVFGMIEKREEALYNAAVLLNPAGEIEGIYRKAHLTADERRWAKPGDELPVFSTKELGRVGLMLGYDALFPEVAGVMAVNRADLLVIPAVFREEMGCEVRRYPGQDPEPDSAEGMIPWDTLARDVQAPVVVAQFAGHPLQGRSAVYTLRQGGESTRVQAASRDREEVLLANFSTAREEGWFNQVKLNQTRRTAFYKPLVLPAPAALVGSPNG